MKNIKWLLLMAVVFVMAACSLDQPGSESSSDDKGDAGKDGDKAYKIGLSVSTLNNPFF